VLICYKNQKANRDQGNGVKVELFDSKFNLSGSGRENHWRDYLDEKRRVRMLAVTAIAVI